MNNETYSFELTKSKRYPAFWEEGGSWSNTGSAKLICDSKGMPKKPLFERNGGHLACSEHALFIPNKGDWICSISHQRGDCHIMLYQLTEPWIEEDKAYAGINKKYEFIEGEWIDCLYKVSDETMFNDLAMLDEFIKAAKSKVTSYHCRSMYYGTRGDN